MNSNYIINIQNNMQSLTGQETNLRRKFVRNDNTGSHVRKLLDIDDEQHLSRNTTYTIECNVSGRYYTAGDNHCYFKPRPRTKVLNASCLSKHTILRPIRTFIS